MMKQQRDLEWLMSLTRAQFNSATFAPGNSRWRASLTDEQKAAIAKRISDAQKGRVLSAEMRKRISDAKRGKKLPRTLEWQAKISSALRGRKHAPHSIETKQKISAANKGRLLGRKLGPQSTEHKTKVVASKVRRGLTVRCSTPLGLFDSRAAAARAHRVDPVTLSNWMKQGRPGFYYPDIKDQAKLSSDLNQLEVARTLRVSRSTNRSVVTPSGTFNSVRAAAIFFGVDRSTIVGRIERGWPGYGYADSPSGINDGSTMRLKGKRVKTPLGLFDKVADAANAHQISAPTLRKRLRCDSFQDYGYIND